MSCRIAGIDQDGLELLGHFRLMADPAFENGRGRRENFVHRHGHLAIDRLDRLGGGGAFLRGEQFERVQGGGHLPAKDFGELHVQFGEAVGLRTFDVEGADHLVAQDQGHGQGTAGPLGPFEVERIDGRVGAQVALAGGGHEAGDAVALLPGEEHAFGRLLQSCPPPGAAPVRRFRAEEANFDDVVMQQVLGEPANILLEQLDAFLDAHLGQLFDLQAGQFAAGLVQGVELLLLLHLGGDVPAQADELVNLPSRRRWA